MRLSKIWSKSELKLNYKLCTCKSSTVLHNLPIVFDVFAFIKFLLFHFFISFLYNWNYKKLKKLVESHIRRPFIVFTNKIKNFLQSDLKQSLYY